jgi:ankyrin repeat protein
MLSIDILEYIGFFLTSQEYQNLRLSSKEFRLNCKQRVRLWFLALSTTKEMFKAQNPNNQTDFFQVYMQDYHSHSHGFEKQTCLELLFRYSRHHELQRIVTYFKGFPDWFKKDVMEANAMDCVSNHQTLEILLRYTSPTNHHGYQKYKWAIEKGDSQMVYVFLQDGRIDPSFNQDFAIRVSSQLGFLSIVEMLLNDSRVNPGCKENEAIGNSCSNGFLEITKLLLKHPKVDPSDRKNFALRFASQNGHAEIVKILLQDDRVDPRFYGSHALRVACELGHLEIATRLLRDPRSNPAQRRNYCFRMACRNGHVQIVGLLLQDKRVDPTAYNYQGVKEAIKRNHVDIITLLSQDPRITIKSAT